MTIDLKKRVCQLIEKVFSDLVLGEITTMEAGKRLHQVCNQRGLNPAVELPITMLMLTASGQMRLKLYEEFIMQANWLVAKVSAEEMSIASAVTAFVEELEEITKQMLKGNS